MQAKIKEKQGVAKQVVTKPAHSATPIISNQAEFNAWFQSLNAGPGWEPQGCEPDDCPH